VIPFSILRKILLTLAPLVLFYLLKKQSSKGEVKRKSSLSDFDKSKIVEGEIVEDRKSYEKSKKTK